MRLLTILQVAMAILLLQATGAFSAPLEVLIEERARQSYGAELPEAGQFAITVKDPPVEDVVMLADFWMDPVTGQFLTNAVFPDGDVRRLSGLALITLPVPVPVRRMMPGEIVTEADLDVADMPLGRVGSFAVTDRAAIVGMEVRRMLSPGRPVQVQSVIEPRVIERGDRVEIRFTDGALSLTAPGRALADAHRGQDVRIVNLVSNKPVNGIAAAEGIVEIVR